MLAFGRTLIYVVEIELRSSLWCKCSFDRHAVMPRTFPLLAYVSIYLWQI